MIPQIKAYNMLLQGNSIAKITKDTGLFISEVNKIATRGINPKPVYLPVLDRLSVAKYPVNESEDEILWQPPTYEQLKKRNA